MLAAEGAGAVCVQRGDRGCARTVFDARQPDTKEQVRWNPASPGDRLARSAASCARFGIGTQAG
jgi:hypothetical protein